LSKSILLVNLLHNFLHLPLIIYTLFSLLFILIIKLIYFISSINHSNIMFFMIIYVHFFYWAINKFMGRQYNDPNNLKIYQFLENRVFGHLFATKIRSLCVENLEYNILPVQMQLSIFR
jgi:hypothetical protein